MHWSLPIAVPATVFAAVHGVVTLPVVVQVKLNSPRDNVVVLSVDTTVPAASFHS